MRVASLILALLLAGPPALSGVAFSAEPPREVADFLRKWLADPSVKAPGIGVAAVNRQGIVWSGGFGYADVEKKRPITPQTRFQWASVTKVYTTLILAQLAAEGKIDLDAPLTRYIPEFKSRWPAPGAQPITARHLATHSSGLTNWWGEPSSSYTAAQLLDWQARAGLAAPPGFQMKYSNHGFALLGIVLERATGQKYADLIRQRVFEPLELTSSALTAVPHPDLAASYWEHDGKLVRQATSGIFQAQDPASGLVATIDDVARFAHAHLAIKPGSPVTDEILDMLFTPHTSTIGLGWHYSAGDLPYWWHMGAWNAFYSRIVVRPDVGVGLVFSTNGFWKNDPTGPLVRMLAPYADASPLDRHCGQYVGPRGKTLVVRRPPGPEMTLEIKGVGRMFPMGRHMFQVPPQRGSGAGWVRFVVENGRHVMLFEADKYLRRPATAAIGASLPTGSLATAGKAISIGLTSALAAKGPSPPDAAKLVPSPGVPDRDWYLQSAVLAGQWYLANQNTEEHPWGAVQGSADQGRYVYEYFPARKTARGVGNWGQALGIMAMLALHGRTHEAKYLQSARLAAEYLKSLQILDPRTPRNFGALREATPQTTWTYPRDAATGGLAFAALYRATGEKEYLDRLRLLCDWFIGHCMGREKWPAYQYRFDQEQQDRTKKQYFMVGSGLMFYCAYRLTSEKRYIREGLVPLCDPLAEDYHVRPWGPFPPQLESRGVWPTQDDFASQALLAAYRATGDKKYFSAARRHADWLVSAQQDNGAYSGFGSAVYVSGLHLLDLCRIIEEEKAGIDTAPYLRAVAKGARFGLSLQEGDSRDSRAYGAVYGQNPFGVSRDHIHHRETGYSVIFNIRYEGKVAVPYYSIFGWE